jgi:hypothetical protein
MVDVENREDLILGIFFKFATCCKWKGLFVEADLVGSLIAASREGAHLQLAPL